MTVLGSHRPTAIARTWWQAQLRHWSLPAAEAYVKAHPIVPNLASPLDQQEAIRPVTMRARDAETGKEIVVGVAVRRVSDARLWDSLSSDEEWAATRIADAFAQIDRGLGVRNVSVEGGSVMGGIRSGHPPMTRLVVDYFAWGRKCTARRIDHSAIMDVLGYGKSCRTTDCARRRRKGYTREQVGEGLSLYLELHGRITRKAS